MSATQLESCMQAAWDHGRDPFDDADVLALLEQHPELLENAAVWRNSIASLPAAAPTTTPTVAPTTAAHERRVYPRLIAGVAAAAMAFVLWPDSAPPAEPSTSHAGTPSSTPRAEARVLHTSLVQRVEHHGSACSIHTLEVATGSPDTPRPRKFTSRVVQTTRTPLDL